MGFRVIAAKSITLAALITVGLLSTNISMAKVMVLPKGVGIWKYAVRNYTSMSNSFNEDGEIKSTGDSFKQNFKGEDLAREGKSSDLGVLASEIKKFDYGAGSKGLLSGLDLGTLNVDVDASVNAQIFATGYGVTDWLTVYAGVPYMTVDVTTDMRFVGTNNANDLKARLGDLSYEELKDGLSKAGNLNVYMVKESLAELGYTGVDSWNHQGFGDINFGTMLASNFLFSHSVEISPYAKANFTLPTGHVDDPNVLTDTSVGYGYFSSGFTGGGSVTYKKHFYVGLEGTYQLNQSHTSYVRKPENEWSSLAPIENLETITIEPGNKSEVSFYAGLDYSIFSAKIMFSDYYRAQDVVQGVASPLYDRFTVGTDQAALYQTLTAALSTAELYQKGDFAIPVMLTMSHKKNLYGFNAAIDNYYEFELASFYTFN